MSKSQRKSETQKHNEKAKAKENLERRKQLKNAYQWKPHDNVDEDVSVQGEVADFQWVPTKNPDYPEMPILYIKSPDRDGYTALPSMHSVLQNELGRINVEVGDYIYVEYLGEEEGEMGTYHDYIVSKQGAEEERDKDLSSVFSSEDNQPFES